jgi:hypothetical protein
VNPWRAGIWLLVAWEVLGHRRWGHFNFYELAVFGGIPVLIGADYVLGVGLYDWRTGVRLPVEPPVADEMIRLPVP